MSSLNKQNLIFTALRDDIDISSFKCESEELNDFLTKRAKFNDENLLSKVYLYYDKATKKVVGFITLSNYLLRLSDAKEFGIQKVPGALIGRIAIDNDYRGYNLGKELIQFALGRCHYIKNYIGCRLLVVEVKKEDPIKNYLVNLGFELFHESKGFFILGMDLLI